MFGLEELAKLGLPALLAVAILGLVQLLNKKYRESELGDRRIPPKVIQCPNNVKDFPATLKGMVANLDASTKMLTKLANDLERTRVEMQSVSNVANLHAAGSRSEKIREESRDILRELLMVIKRRNGA